MEPDRARPQDLRNLFHSDEIQGLISKYASSIFEVRVQFVEHEGTPYPIIVVPPGVLIPVAAKADLLDPKSCKKLITFGGVYFRTLRANGRVSTSVAQPDDWEEIIEICMTNKEGDVAKFLRTYFPEFPNVLDRDQVQPPSSTLRKQSQELLQVARDCFNQLTSGHEDD